MMKNTNTNTTTTTTGADILATTRGAIDIIKKTADQTAKNGGATVSLIDGYEPYAGYAVSVAGLGYDFDFSDGADITPALREFAASRLAYLLDDSYFLGTWIDETTGRLYFDITLVTFDKDEALTVARDTGELAIYDIARGVEIRTDDEPAGVDLFDLPTLTGYRLDALNA